jgi:DNA recombination protein RmuC
MFEISASIIVLIVLILVFITGFFILARKISSLKETKSDQNLIEWLKTMQSSLDSSTGNMVKTLQENSRQLNERLDKTAIAVKDVEKEVGKMSEIGRNMQELQEFLKSPKLRGNIGEQVLNDMISQTFPKNSFNLQYQFKSGEKVDAAIKTDAGILSIDSKFPMENFQKMTKAGSKEEKEVIEREFIKDVKKHIASISKKYILPGEGTLDFALMYVPSESVYYEVINLPGLMEFAKTERIYVVSPSTLYAHLQMILLSYEGKKMESKSREIFNLMRAIQIDYKKVNDNLGVLGKHINNASSQFSNLSNVFGSMGKKLNIKHLDDTIEEIDELESLN